MASNKGTRGKELHSNGNAKRNSHGESSGHCRGQSSPYVDSSAMMAAAVYDRKPLRRSMSMRPAGVSPGFANGVMRTYTKPARRMTVHGSQSYPVYMDKELDLALPSIQDRQRRSREIKTINSEVEFEEEIKEYRTRQRNKARLEFYRDDNKYDVPYVRGNASVKQHKGEHKVDTNSKCNDKRSYPRPLEIEKRPNKKGKISRRHSMSKSSESKSAPPSKPTQRDNHVTTMSDKPGNYTNQEETNEPLTKTNKDETHKKRPKTAPGTIFRLILNTGEEIRQEEDGKIVIEENNNHRDKIQHDYVSDSHSTDIPDDPVVLDKLDNDQSAEARTQNHDPVMMRNSSPRSVQDRSEYSISVTSDSIEATRVHSPCSMEGKPAPDEAAAAAEVKVEREDQEQEMDRIGQENDKQPHELNANATPYQSPSQEKVYADLNIDEFRSLYRRDVVELNKNLNNFKQQCQTELSKYERRAERRKQKLKDEMDQLNKELTNKRRLVKDTRHLEQAQLETSILKKKNSLLELQDSLVQKEDALLTKQAELNDYEKEIDEIEGYLHRRHEITQRKEEDIRELDQEVNRLNEMLVEEKKNLQQKMSAGENVQEDRSKLAQLQWDLVRKTILDKQATTEAAFQQTKRKLSEAQEKLGEKNNEIDETKKSMKNLQSQIQQKDKKIQDLQRHLTISAKPKEDLVQRQLSNQNISTGVSHPKSNGRVEKGTSSSSHGSDTFRRRIRDMDRDRVSQKQDMKLRTHVPNGNTAAASGVTLTRSNTDSNGTDAKVRALKRMLDAQKARKTLDGRAKSAPNNSKELSKYYEQANSKTCVIQ